MSELVILENINAVAIYKDGGLNKVIEKIEAEVRSFVPDMSTEKGRKEIAAVAYKVAKSKTALDKAGKDLVSGWKEQAKLVDASRRDMRGRLDSLKDEVRQPLTEWEDADKLRIAAHEASIAEIETSGLVTAAEWQSITLDEMKYRLKVTENITTENYDEFSVKAKLAKDQAIINIKHGISQREAYEKAEAARIEAEKKAQAEREAQIAKEAADRARLEAEEKANQARIKAEKAEAERIAEIEAEKEKAENAAKDVQEKIERERKEAAETMRAAEEKAKQEKQAAIQARKNAEEKARQEATRIKSEAEAGKRDAIQAERDRVAVKEAEERGRKEAEEAAAKEKADNKAHQKKINNEALKSIMAIGISEVDGIKLITAIARKEIKHIFMGY